jgi:hypothetical protein
MTEELQVLCDIATRLEAAEIDYMLTGSVALNSYAPEKVRSHPGPDESLDYS